MTSSPPSVGDRDANRRNWMRAVAFSLGCDSEQLLRNAMGVRREVWMSSAAAATSTRVAPPLPCVGWSQAAGGLVLGAGVAEFPLLPSGPLPLAADGDTLLHLACRHGKPDCVELLLVLGACNRRHPNDKGEYARELARPFPRCAEQFAKTSVGRRISFAAGGGASHRGFAVARPGAVAAAGAVGGTMAAAAAATAAAVAMPPGTEVFDRFDNQLLYVNVPLHYRDTAERRSQDRQEQQRWARESEADSRQCHVYTEAARSVWPRSDRWFDAFEAAGARRPLLPRGASNLPWRLHTHVWVKDTAIVGDGLPCWARMEARLSFEDGCGVLGLARAAAHTLDGEPYTGRRAGLAAERIVLLGNGEENMSEPAKGTRRHSTQFRLTCSKGGQVVEMRFDNKVQWREWKDAITATLAHASRFYKARVQQRIEAEAAARARTERAGVFDWKGRGRVRASRRVADDDDFDFDFQVEKVALAVHETPPETRRKLRQTSMGSPLASHHDHHGLRARTGGRRTAHATLLDAMKSEVVAAGAFTGKVCSEGVLGSDTLREGMLEAVGGMQDKLESAGQTAHSVDGALLRMKLDCPSSPELGAMMAGNKASPRSSGVLGMLGARRPSKDGRSPSSLPAPAPPLDDAFSLDYTHDDGDK